jgi:hypothetical protein
MTPLSKAVALYLVPTDKHCPEKKLLVEDVASLAFRFKLSKEVFIQWTYRGDGFGFQCKSKELAQQCRDALEDVKNNVRSEAGLLSEKFPSCTSENEKLFRLKENKNILAKRNDPAFIVSDVQFRNSVLKKPASEDYGLSFH